MSDKKLPHLLVLAHLGLGDHLVFNAIYRKLAASYHTFVLCKRHNTGTLNFMLRDLRNVDSLVIDDDAKAREFADIVEANGHAVLRLGDFQAEKYDRRFWDREIFRQAGLNFHDRWNEFKVARQPSRELPVPPKPFVLIHEDPPRGFVIDRALLPKDIPVVSVEPGKSNCLFDWWGHVEMAVELHLIDSCVAIMADSLPELRATKKMIHLYARPGALPPSYTKNWVIVLP